MYVLQVEAAIAVQMMLSSKGESARQYLEPQIREITLELLNIIRETENDDLTSVMQKIVCTYTEQLVPVAVDICQHLVGTFAQVHSTPSVTLCFLPIFLYFCGLGVARVFVGVSQRAPTHSHSSTYV
jgi:hypothetical protein